MAGFENISIPDLNPRQNVTSLSLSLLDMDRFRMCVLCFSLLLTPPTHAYLLWLIVKERGIALEFLNFNLSVCEIAISVNYFLYMVNILVPRLGTYLTFANGLDMTGRPLFQCLMCVERYLAVVHPVTFLKYKPLRYRLICTFFSWTLIFGGCLFSLFTSTNHIIAHMCGLLLEFILFLSTDLFCCLSVLWALKKPGPGVNKRDDGNLMKKRAFYLILITTMTMVVMFLPATILFVLFLCKSWTGISMFQSFSFVCFSLSGFVQATMYFKRAGKLNGVCWRLK